MTEKEKQEMNKSEGGPSSVKKSRLSTDDTQFKSKGRWTVVYVEGGLDAIWYVDGSSYICS